MRLTRVFHPIGQGAFYTEKHEDDNGRVFNVVYDCGSVTIKGKKLEQKIKGAYAEKETIDILFISHLHSDHISGIDYLKKYFEIRKVVMPLIDPDTRVLLKINNYLRDSYTNTDIIDNPVGYFANGKGNETEVVFVEPSFFEAENFREGDNILGLPDDWEAGGSRIASGTEMNSNLKDHDWVFVPYNYKQPHRIVQFLDTLKLKGLELKDIDTIDKIVAFLPEIRYAYEKLDGDLNQNSMILFSGKSSAPIIRCHSNNLCYPLSYHWIFEVNVLSGCIYFGDIDLNQSSIVKDIHSKLLDYLPWIGTVQIPHHGAVRNFSESILTSDMKWAVVSFGTTNQFGHPAHKVLTDIIVNGTTPVSVTESLETMVIQWGEI